MEPCPSPHEKLHQVLHDSFLLSWGPCAKDRPLSWKALLQSVWEMETHFCEGPYYLPSEMVITIALDKQGKGESGNLTYPRSSFWNSGPQTRKPSCSSASPKNCHLAHALLSYSLLRVALCSAHVQGGDGHHSPQGESISICPHTQEQVREKVFGHEKN